MPCYATGTAEGDARLAKSEAHEQLTKVTRLLCAVMDAWNTGGPVPTEAHEWWAEHQRVDLERQEQVARAAEEQRAREELRARLTPRERKLLGIS